ncbi:Uncharacterised protein [Acinetobacter baumannii]|nr:Uncharacterised protein [Acinetobacter baumannii]
MEGNACHRDRLAAGLAARGQGDVEQLGGLLRVLVEQLVEVAHAIEHQLVGVLMLQFEVLLHHRRVLCEIGIWLIHQWFTARREGARFGVLKFLQY